MAGADVEAEHAPPRPGDLRRSVLDPARAGRSSGGDPNATSTAACARPGPGRTPPRSPGARRAAVLAARRHPGGVLGRRRARAALGAGRGRERRRGPPRVRADQRPAVRHVRAVGRGLVRLRGRERLLVAPVGGLLPALPARRARGLGRHRLDGRRRRARLARLGRDRRRGAGAARAARCSATRGARDSVLLLALYPVAFVFTSVYPEGLFLALAAGSFLAALQGRGLLAGVLAALAVGDASARARARAGASRPALAARPHAPRAAPPGAAPARARAAPAVRVAPGAAARRLGRVPRRPVGVLAAPHAHARPARRPLGGGGVGLPRRRAAAPPPAAHGRGALRPLRPDRRLVRPPLRAARARRAG